MLFDDRCYDNEEGAQSETALEQAMFRREAGNPPAAFHFFARQSFYLCLNHPAEQQITTDYKASRVHALTQYPSFAVASPATIISCFQPMISARIGSPN